MLSPNKNPRFRVVLPTQSIPCGILDENSGQLYLNFGSSYKTSDFMIDNLQSWWTSLPNLEQQETQLIQLKIDNGPESSGIRTQFLKRRVDFSDKIGKPIQLLYYPPYHSKYNPTERCWGILEQHWNGILLRGYSDPLRMGTEYDLEGNSSQGLVEEQDVLKRHLTLQTGNA